MKEFQWRLRRSRSCAFGTLLLAMSLNGIALRLPQAQAQPAPTVPTKKSPKPLSPEQKAAIAKVISASEATQVGELAVDIKIRDASIEQVIARIKATFPGQPIFIEVRGASPVKVSFDLKGARVGNVLNNVAGLAGCRLWVVGTGLLIAPRDQLTKIELADMKAGEAGSWALNVDAPDLQGGESTFSVKGAKDRLLARALGQEITGSDAEILPALKVKMTFGELSAEGQKMLQRIAASASDDAQMSNPKAIPIRFNPTSPISFDTSQPGWIQIGVDPDTSDDRNTVAQIGLSIATPAP